jgi:hypothetical protein
MDPTGLIRRIILAVSDLDSGRKGLTINGSEHAGRITYERGLFGAMSAFREADAAKVPETLILLEHAFLTEEYRCTDPADHVTLGSLGQAIASFDDALRSLEVARDAPAYRGAEKTHPRSSKYRYHTMPKDAFHLACIAHRTRFTNILKTPGLNPTEKSLYHQRSANMTAAQSAYRTLQETALTEASA